MSAWAESPLFTIQETKRGQAPRSIQQPQLDLSDMPKKSAPKTFVIQETKQAPRPVAQGPGIVGLDMLIQADRYPVVQYVFRQTPAAQAGMRPGDTIVAVDGRQTIGRSRAQVDQMISDVPGDIVTFTVVRDGEMREFRLTVMALEDVPAPVKPNFFALYP